MTFFKTFKKSSCLSLGAWSCTVVCYKKICWCFVQTVI